MASEKDHHPLPVRGDSLEEDEHVPWLGQETTQRHNRSRLLTLITILAALFVAVGISSVFIVMSKKVPQAQAGPPMLWDYFLENENAWKQPEVIERIYQDDDPDFQNKNLSIANQYWSTLYPDGLGIVGLTDQEVAEFGLRDSIRGWHDQSKRLYFVGVYHQLHCLGVLRNNSIKHYEDPTFSIATTFHHTMHCVDVLRQALICGADSALIHRSDRTEGLWPGDNLITKCRNFDALRDWTKTHEYIPAPSEWVP